MIRGVVVFSALSFQFFKSLHFTGALQKALCEDTPGPSPADSGFRELQQRIISYVRGLPGNNSCCDCGGTNGMRARELMTEILQYITLVHFTSSFYHTITFSFR